MKNIGKMLFIAMCMSFIQTAAVRVSAQEDETAPRNAKTDSYDPLVPQLFAFDKDNNVFAGINNTDNTIDLIRYDGDRLERYKSILVDAVRKRHDVDFIYRPKSVAIYEGHIVFLASQRDSCYLAVLDMDGNMVRKLTFAGEASAFSFSHEAQELYIAGETDEGYDVVALDASGGMNAINLTDAASVHYRKPKLSETIAEADPWGIGMAVVAMSVVFLSLLLLYLVFKNVGRTLIRLQNKRKREHEAVQKHESVSVADTSGEIYAAISAAVHLYNEELHDEESTVLTINKVSRTYSPWSSKIQGMNTYFRER